jgi:hypothetical protein
LPRRPVALGHERLNQLIEFAIGRSLLIDRGVTVSATKASSPGSNCT